jgi:hypothetical protein
MPGRREQLSALFFLFPHNVFGLLVRPESEVNRVPTLLTMFGSVGLHLPPPNWLPC